jgi:hypothetical protein
MENETQQREGHTSTRSLPHRRVTPNKSDTFADKKQDSDQGLKRLLRRFDLIKPHITWVIFVAGAIYQGLHSDVLGFIILLATAEGRIPLPLAIDYLQSHLGAMQGYLKPMISPPSEEQEARGQPGKTAAKEQQAPDGQPGEKATDEQDKPM